MWFPARMANVLSEQRRQQVVAPAWRVRGAGRHDRPALGAHLPLHRLEKIYAGEGLELARSTPCGWHEQLRGARRSAARGDVDGCPGRSLPVHRATGAWSRWPRWGVGIPQV